MVAPTYEGDFMKPEKPKGVKGRVVVTVNNEETAGEVTLYRGGKMGLAFRSPAHRVFKQAARQRRGGDAATQGTSASAAVSQQQGGSQ